MWRTVVLCGAVLLLLSACEKEIAIKLNPSPTNLVVDASIENGSFPYIVLSSSLSYFSQISPEILSKSFVHHAQVIVSNGVQAGLLREDSTDLNLAGLKLYFYTFHTGDTGVQFRGALNTAYTLRIQTDSQVFTSSTHIPGLNKKIDSLWWIPAPPGNDSGDVLLKARITDPQGYGDYTRYFTSVDGGVFFPGLNSVFDDQITDGTTYDVEVDRGVDRNTSINLTTSVFFQRGDTVTVRYSNIDKATFDFWQTMEFNYQAIGNPFSTPIHVLGNISNNALGYFGGYASQYITLPIPK